MNKKKIKERERERAYLFKKTEAPKGLMVFSFLTEKGKVFFFIHQTDGGYEG